MVYAYFKGDESEILLTFLFKTLQQLYNVSGIELEHDPSDYWLLTV